MRIIKNSVKCLKCGEVLVSLSQEKIHCQCRNISIWGGNIEISRAGIGYLDLSDVEE